MMKLRKLWLVGLLLSFSVTSNAANLFLKGSKGIGVVLGSGSVNFGLKSENYIIGGVSLSYFVMNNLELGVGYRGWFGGDPTLHQVTIPATYYFPLKGKVRPYGGGFVRQTWSSDSNIIDDYNSYGGRLGVVMITSRNSYVGIGWVQEYYDDCDQWKDCSNGYAEFTFSIGL